MYFFFCYVTLVGVMCSFSYISFLDFHRFANPAQNTFTVVPSDSITVGICGDSGYWVECESDSNGLLQVPSVMMSRFQCVFTATK